MDSLKARAGSQPWRDREVARLVALLGTETRYYKEVVASLPVGAVIVSGATGILYANRAFRRLLNARSEALQDKEAGEILNAPHLTLAIQQTLADQVLRSGIQVEFSGQCFRVSVIPMRSWDDDEREVVVVLEESSGVALPPVDPPSTEYPALLWTMHPDTQQFETVAGSASLLLGYSEQHWLSTPGFWLERVHPLDRPSVESFYRAAIEKGGEFACEYRAAGPEPAGPWCRDSFRITTDPQGHPARIHGVTIDVTARRNAEQDNLLANRVDALAGLSRRLSHELNNALMIVTGYGEDLLAHLPEDDALRSDVKAILAAAESLAGISGELGGFTRKQAAGPVVTDICGLLPGVAARIREELGATVVTRIPDKPLRGLVDPTQFEAALMSVARRLRDRNDPHLVLLARATSVDQMANLPSALPPGPYVEICLRGPYGTGIESRDFEAFLSGTDPHGSDMARTFAIVREWGGSVSAGRSDHASEVRILLPAASAAKIDSPQLPAVPSEPVTAAGPAAPVPQTIFLVQTESGIRALMSKILKREGFAVVEAGSATEALDAELRHHGPIHLLITDIALPGKGGRELAEELTRKHPSLPVLYVAAFAEDADTVAKAIEPQASWLQKPFTLSRLVKIVRATLGDEALTKATGA